MLLEYDEIDMWRTYLNGTYQRLMALAEAFEPINARDVDNLIVDDPVDTSILDTLLNME